MADREDPADHNLRRGAKRPGCCADKPGNRLSLSSLGFGHGGTIEAHLSDSWTAEVTVVSDKRWYDLSGSDPANSDDDCASIETEKAYHGIPSVYDGLEPGAEILLRFNRFRVCSCLFGHFEPSPSNVHNLVVPLS